MRAGSCPHTGLKIVPTSPLFVVFRVFRGKKGLEAGGGTAASPSTQGREAAAPPAHANLGAMVLATKNTKSAFFSAFSAISAVKNNAAEVFVFNRKERKDRKETKLTTLFMNGSLVPENETIETKSRRRRVRDEE